MAINTVGAASNNGNLSAASGQHIGGISLGGFLNDAGAALNRFNNVANANTAASVANANALNDWQVQQNAKAMAFSANEAAKNRDWQEMMSNTAHQREVRDLQAAGLNPVLSAMNGNGAAVGSGATASGVTSSGAKGEVDASVNAAFANLLGGLLNYRMNQEAVRTQTAANLAIAERNNSANELISRINADAAVRSAGIHAGGQVRAAELSAEASKVASALNFISNVYNTGEYTDAMRYGAEMNYGATTYSADRNYAAQRYSSDNYLEGSMYSADIARGNAWINAGSSLVNTLIAGMLGW